MILDPEIVFRRHPEVSILEPFNSVEVLWVIKSSGLGSVKDPKGRASNEAGTGQVFLYPYPYPCSKCIPIHIPVPIPTGCSNNKPIPIPIPIGFCRYAGFIQVRGVQKNSKPKTEPKNRKNLTEKPVNQTNFSKKSVKLIELKFFFGFRFGYSLDYLKIRLTGS